MATETNITAFFEFVYDRQAVWHKRNILQLPAPWSSDPVLQKYRFCNVYRELDGGTLAIGKYLKDGHLSVEQKLFNIIAYRFFNRRDSIENLFGGLLDPQKFDWKYYEQRFDAKKLEGSIFSNAYLISSHPVNPSYRPQDKHIQILLMLEGLKHKLPTLIEELRNNKAQDGLKIISNSVKMAGPFLSGQILLDATYAQNIIPYSGNDFLIVGPGAHWGLNLIFETKLSKKEADAKCRFLHQIQADEFAKLKKATGKNWDDVRYKDETYANQPYLILHDIQNSLCEFRKYWRLKDGEKAKRRYFPAAANS